MCPVYLFISAQKNARMKISVVLCAYNGESFIEEQLTSIANQTHAPHEIMLCDDQSTDSTVEIARSTCARHRLNGVISINENRLGVEQNFSQAMGKASGDVIFFCDQDDVWMPEKVEKMIAPFQADSTVALVYSDGQIVGPKLEPTGYSLFTKSPKKKLQDGDAREVGKLLRYGHAPGIKASSAAFSSRVRDLAGPIPDGIAHDSWIAFFGYALGKVAVVNAALYAYRRHDQTAGKSSSNALISGLNPHRDSDPIAMLKEKARLAHCLYERMCEIDAESRNRHKLPARFAILQTAAKNAAHTLNARVEIRKSSRVENRLAKGIAAFIKGDYRAVDGYAQRVKICCKDIGLYIE